MLRRTHEALRPRIAGDRESELLDACVALLIEAGYDRLTMDAVARRAKASKATLYRRWSSKPSLVVDAVLRSKKSHDMRDVDTGTLRGDLLATFCGPGGPTDTDNTRLLAAVMTALHTDEEFAAEFRERFLGPKTEVSRRIYARAAARGELADGVDLSLLGPALAGILLHRAFLLGDRIDAALVEKVVDQIILPAATGRPSPPSEGTP